jgi:hypothetical protein
MRLLAARTIAKLATEAGLCFGLDEPVAQRSSKEARTGEACVAEDVEALEQG